MMIATIDKRHSTLKLTTLMRDMLVNIPGHGYGKLNSAAARGGVELLFQTIEENFHITLTQYVLVDFYMFVDIIDALGGVKTNSEGLNSPGKIMILEPNGILQVRELKEDARELSRYDGSSNQFGMGVGGGAMM